MRCISRITDDTYCQKFGNGRNKFYVEMRCPWACAAGSDICSKCSIRVGGCKIQGSRRFNHGKVTEPIPYQSHIYGGKWYEASVKKFGSPTEEIIQFAEKYSKEAREGLEVACGIEECNTEIPKPVSIPKPRRSKKVSTPYSALASSTEQFVQKEAVIPTHIEQHMEEFDTDGFKIEYVRLSIFEHEGSTYYRDAKKEKLYRKNKDKIGAYVGRYNPENGLIVTDIPDSDDEN